MPGPDKHDYLNAVMSQDACNLSGIVFEFAKVMEKICDQAHAEGHGTEWKNTHPISRLYAEQIMYLACGGEWKDAYAICYARSQKDD